MMNVTPNHTFWRICVTFAFTDLLASMQRASRLVSPCIWERANDATSFLSNSVEPGWPHPYSELPDILFNRVRVLYLVDPSAPLELMDRAGIALSHGFSDLGMDVTLRVRGPGTACPLFGPPTDLVTAAMLEGLVAWLPDEPED